MFLVWIDFMIYHDSAAATASHVGLAKAQQRRSTAEAALQRATEDLVRRLKWFKDAKTAKELRKKSKNIKQATGCLVPLSTCPGIPY